MNAAPISDNHSSLNGALCGQATKPAIVVGAATSNANACGRTLAACGAKIDADSAM